MKYEVTARVTVDADSPQAAVAMFDAEYRDARNVVHLSAEAASDWMDWTESGPPATAEPTEWQLEEITCHACNTQMTRLALYGHECPELKASRERGARLLEALSTLDPDEGKFE